MRLLIGVCSYILLLGQKLQILNFLVLVLDQVGIEIQSMLYFSLFIDLIVM